ncbi:acyl-CoA carboxylase epsilon subunit [Streptomyces sp. NPDC017082]|uniref:acyl-CoA carboxylase epsilon subunit n=1 Tax=Streptomyces sp. NPDC017082 TaxID=3364974 RepID=UPI0037A47D4F
MTIRVVRGNPTPEELAAALAVVRARAAAAAAAPGAAEGAAEGARGPRDAWSDPARIAAARVPSPGQASWSRTYWPG